MPRPLLYVTLGPAGSGRRALIDDLIAAGAEWDGEKVGTRVLLRHRDHTDPGADAITKGVPNVFVLDWEWDAEHIRAPQLSPGAGGPDDSIFLLGPGTDDPRPFLEALPEMLAHYDFELGRILTVVDSQLAHDNPELEKYWDCCVHFSDAVILANREQVPNKWLQALQDRYIKEQRMPCLFVLAKGQRVDNPAFVLEPEPRRLSLHFDEFEELSEEEAFAEEEEGAAPGEEPWFEKIPGTGRYRVGLPDPADFIG